MKAHLAKIYNFTCDRNKTHWWSVDGIEPLTGQILICPHCGHKNVVEDVVDHTIRLEQPERTFEHELPDVSDVVGIWSDRSE